MLRVIKSFKLEKSNFYSGPHHQLNFNACWERYLNNPLLNSLYKDDVCYTERWYLETRRLINEGIWSHPLLNIVVRDENLKSQLVKSAVIDGALMRSVLRNDDYPEYQISAGVNLKKLNRWCAFFVSLPSSIEILSRLNGPTAD